MSSTEFAIKDSGERIEYDSGMRRDVQDGKTKYLLVRDGPMFYRWAEHLTKGAEKYGDRNWQLASSEEELERFYESAARHFEQWLNSKSDEDHAAAVFFNINAVEYVKNKMSVAPVEPERMSVFFEFLQLELGGEVDEEN